MTPDQFRGIALSLSGAVEGAHGGHPDFRVGGKVFASLGAPGPGFGMVKLTPDQQAMLIDVAPKVFKPSAGAWGLRGYTSVHLPDADADAIKHALTLAWQGFAKTQPKSPGKSARAPSRAKKAPSADRTFARAVKAAKATKLPGIEQGTSYGTPSLTVRGKFMMRVKDADTFAFRCTMEEKTFLMEAVPSIYFETDHYVGWPVVLVRAGASDAELAHCVERAWRVQAPKRLKAGRDPASGRENPSKKESPARKTSRAKRTRA
jgi:hypothetical protein